MVSYALQRGQVPQDNGETGVASEARSMYGVVPVAGWPAVVPEMVRGLPKWRGLNLSNEVWYFQTNR